MGMESSDVVRFDLGPPSRSKNCSLALVSCLSNVHWFSDALGLVFNYNVV